MTNKYLILLFFLLAMSTITYSKKNILPIEIVAIQADKIVIGEIISVKNNSYNLKVTENIKGGNESLIIVQKFEEWTCDIRYAEVEIGQKLFLFLKNIENKFEIINGSTGEIPIINNRITLQNEEYKHIKYESHPYSIDLMEFKTGIIKFINCFAMSGKSDTYYPDSLLQKCNDEEFKLLYFTNKFCGWICFKVKTKYVIIKS